MTSSSAIELDNRPMYLTVLDNSEQQVKQVDPILSSPYWTDRKVVTQEFQESARQDWMARHIGMLSSASTDALLWKSYEMTLPNPEDDKKRPYWWHLGDVNEQGMIEHDWSFQAWYDLSIRKYARSYEYAIPKMVDVMIWIERHTEWSAREALDQLGIGRLKQLSQSRNTIEKTSKMLPPTLLHPHNEFHLLVTKAFAGDDMGKLVWDLEKYKVDNKEVAKFLNQNLSSGTPDVVLQTAVMPPYHVHQKGDRYRLWIDDLTEAQLSLIEHVIRAYSERSID